MTEPILSVDFDISLRYAHGLGDLSPYFSALTRGEALATRCDECERTWFAPRLVCVCGCRHMTWRALNGGGILLYLTSGLAIFPGTAIKGVFEYALIRLDGASNLCLGRVIAGELTPQPNQRVQLVKSTQKWIHPAQSADFTVDVSGQ